MEQVKQTAVEWLVEQIKEYDFSPRDNTYLIEIPSWIFKEKIEQANAMHKQEIINTYRDGRSDQQSEKPSRFYNRWAELYYYETYGGNK
jgi:hypothetical protein